MPSRRNTISLSAVVLAAVLAARPVAGAAPAAVSFDDVPERTSEGAPARGAPAVMASPVAGALAAILGEASGSLHLGDQAADAGVLRDVYGERGFAPLWLDGGAPNARVASLARAIAQSARDGLDPEDYPLPTAAAPADHDALARYDLAMSAALIRWAMDLSDGRVTPRQADPEHFIYHRDLDPVGVLEGVAFADDVAGYLGGLAPGSQLYRGLRRALLSYRALAASGGWAPLPDGPTLKPGMTDPRVVQLRDHLKRTGDLSLDSRQPEVFDQGLAFAVEAFQRRHGLDVDGAVGLQTLAALNVPVDERIRQIVVNMERARWLPPHLGDRHVVVNMAGFELALVEHGSIDLTMRVIVGKTYRQTPVFSGQISYLEFNPYWTVPFSIATQDLLPKAKQDPGYLANQGIRVFAGDSEVSVWSVSWSDLGRGNFPYTLRQDPGRQNALGRVKFMFPNRHAVYLHDTPSRTLFARAERTFSSGCIRVEKPLDLAHELLRDDGWSLERIERTIESGERRVARLPVPVPVHLTYVTAWAGEGGSINFRKDIYGRDQRLAQALFAGE